MRSKAATKEDRKLRELADARPPLSHTELTQRMNKYTGSNNGEYYYASKYENAN